MFVVGITGGIGCGKSQVSQVFREKGALVLDADEVSRRMTDVDGRALPAVRELLGSSFFHKDGSLNRKLVAETVFSNKKLLDEYSRIIHKEVLDEMGETIDAENKKGTKLVVMDVPIPVKRGFVDVCNQVLVISCDDELRLRRLTERGMSELDARRRMAMQMSREEYEELSDFVIDNSGSLSALEEQVNVYISAELGKRGIRI